VLADVVESGLTSPSPSERIGVGVRFGESLLVSSLALLFGTGNLQEKLRSQQLRLDHVLTPSLSLGPGLLPILVSIGRSESVVLCRGNSRVIA
jgi:hypothetical protein